MELTLVFGLPRQAFMPSCVIRPFGVCAGKSHRGSPHYRGMAVSLPSGHSDEWGLPPVIGQLTVFTDSRAIPVGISLIPVALPCAQLVKFCTHFIAHCYIYWIVYDLEDGAQRTGCLGSPGSII